MTMSIEAISDRMEIQDLIVNYAYALETHDPDALDKVFTEDARIDYRAMHGSDGGLETAKAFLAAASPKFAGSQLMVAPSKITLDGDRATARTACFHPTLIDQRGGQTHVFLCGFWYHDAVVRTSHGWRIRERVLERCYYHNLPPDFAFLQAVHGEGCACTRQLVDD